MQGAGSYFWPRATLRLFRCLVCQITVKNANFYPKICSLRASCGPRGIFCPIQFQGEVSQSRSRETRINKAYKLYPAKLGCFATLYGKQANFIKLAIRTNSTPPVRSHVVYAQTIYLQIC